MVGLHFAFGVAMSLVSIVSAADKPVDLQQQLVMSNCADDSGFKSCQAKADSAHQDCLKGNPSQNKTMSCGCDFYTQNVNCAATSCWNKVYECNYQIFGNGFVNNCPAIQGVDGIPYYPLSVGTTDGCTCDVAGINNEIMLAKQFGDQCIPSAQSVSPGNSSAILACKCCTASLARSSIAYTCPKSDPTFAGLETVLAMEKSMNLTWDDCEKGLAGIRCDADLHFPILNDGPYLTPSTLKFGTDKLSNTGGTITEPVLGPKFHWTSSVDQQTYYITAQGLGKAPDNGDGGTSSSGSTGSSGSSGSSSSNGNGNGDGSDTGSSSTTSSGTTSSSSSPSPSPSSGSSGAGKKNGTARLEWNVIGMVTSMMLILVTII